MFNILAKNLILQERKHMANTKLSVNLNKVALIRNSRGANYPDLEEVARDCESFGAQGITLHPRPDERHATYADIPTMKKLVTTELNVEGYPSEKFLRMIYQVRPHQCTLVPDKPGALTSDAGWDTISNDIFLKEICQDLKKAGVRSSLFVDPSLEMIEGAKMVGADRIEFYTGPYAHNYLNDREAAIENYILAAKKARELGVDVNAGHDLNLINLQYFLSKISWTKEVSIGHAIICDALYYGLKNTIQMYLNIIDKA
jgi:pyridoxine 5-phosphate synthase